MALFETFFSFRMYGPFSPSVTFSKVQVTGRAGALSSRGCNTAVLAAFTAWTCATARMKEQPSTTRAFLNITERVGDVFDKVIVLAGRPSTVRFLVWQGGAAPFWGRSDPGPGHWHATLRHRPQRGRQAGPFGARAARNSERPAGTPLNPRPPGSPSPPEGPSRPCASRRWRRAAAVRSHRRDAQ